MRFDNIKTSVEQLAKKHHRSNDDEDIEIIEIDALDIICKYCIDQRYEVDKVPEKLTSKDFDIEEYFELYDSSIFEVYSQYIEYLALEKNDVSELMWHYTKSFWPNQFESKTNYFVNLKGLLERGSVYDFKL